MSDNTLDLSIPLNDVERIRGQLETVARLEREWFEILSIAQNPDTHKQTDVISRFKNFLSGVMAVEQTDTTPDKAVISQYATRLSRVIAFEVFEPIRQQLLADAKELVRQLEQDTRTPTAQAFAQPRELMHRYNEADAQRIDAQLRQQIREQLEAKKAKLYRE